MAVFDNQLARLLLEICRYTYAAGFGDTRNAPDRDDALASIRDANAALHDEPTVVRGNHTSVACIASYPDKNVVAYMGTKTQFNSPENARASAADWFKNLKAPLVPFKLTRDQLGVTQADAVDHDDLGGRVHDGFLEELAAVQGLVVAELMKRGGKGRPLYVTGHSQGGAEAALATRAFVAAGFAVAATYTFAAPRAGNDDFAASVPATLPVHRIEFGDDIVPHVPPMLISREARTIVQGLMAIPFLGQAAQTLLGLVLATSTDYAFRPLGRLCYGSNKTRALRVDLSSEQEAALFYDRLWSLVRHPERWAEHHHLVGTSDDARDRRKGNYTALVSEFTVVG
jgi:Lipase (class 3)